MWVKRLLHTKIKQFPEVFLKRKRDDDLRHTKVDKVYYQDRDGCKGWDEELMPPSNIQKIVSNSKYDS